MRSAWSSVLEAAEAVRTRLQVSMGDHWQDLSPSSSSTINAPSSIKLDLSIPPKLQLSITELNIPSIAGERILSALENAIQGLRAACNAKFEEACLQLLALPSSSELSTRDELENKLADAYKALFRRQVGSWRAEVLRLALARARQVHLPTTKCFASDKADQTPAFNHNYTPMLEAFFAEDQFPSRVDKLFLANKSGMTYRQIHVWFQNRRSRTKRSAANGAELKDYEAISNSETDIEDNMEQFHCTSSRSSSITLVGEEVFLSTKCPLSAYPTKYPPNFDTYPDPFPCRFGDFTSFNKIAWRRRPASPITRQDAVDVSVVTGMFNELQISPATITEPLVSDPPSRWGLQSVRRCSGYDVTSPLTTRPFRAPLPSLIANPSNHKTLPSYTLIRPQCRNPEHPYVGDFPSSTSNLDRDYLTQSGSASRIHFFGDSQHLQSSTRTRRKLVKASFNAHGEAISNNKPMKKKPGLPKRMPTSRTKAYTSERKSLSTPAQIPHNHATALSFGSSPLPMPISASSCSGDPLLSLSSSSSSSEPASPATPSQDVLVEFPDPAEFFTSSFSGNSSEDIPPQLFTSADLTLEHLFSKAPVDDTTNFAHPQSHDALFSSSPFPIDITPPLSFPFSLDFTTLAS